MAVKEYYAQHKSTMAFSMTHKNRIYLLKWGPGLMSKVVNEAIEYYRRPQEPIPWISNIMQDYRTGLIDEEQTLDAYVTMKEQVKYFEESGTVRELKDKLGI